MPARGNSLTSSAALAAAARRSVVGDVGQKQGGEWVGGRRKRRGRVARRTHDTEKMSEYWSERQTEGAKTRHLPSFGKSTMDDPMGAVKEDQWQEKPAGTAETETVTVPRAKLAQHGGFGSFPGALKSGIIEAVGELTRRRISEWRIKARNRLNGGGRGMDRSIDG